MFPSGFGKSATLRCVFPGWGLGGPFIFVKGIGWTCESGLVESWCSVRVCLLCRVKARSGVSVLYLLCNNRIDYSYL